MLSMMSFNRSLNCTSLSLLSKERRVDACQEVTGVAPLIPGTTLHALSPPPGKGKRGEGQYPLNSGARFSENARKPSWMSYERW
ncbi:hypothetical protein D3C81_1210600 [compost metagenome]